MDSSLRTALLVACGLLALGTVLCRPPAAAQPQGAGPCVDDDVTLCLTGERFRVTAGFRTTPSGPTSQAKARPLTEDSGYLWFFDRDNVEVVAKVLDGCAINGYFWFFAAGLTDVAVDILVEDTATARERRYDNALRVPFGPIQDVTAFPCP